MSTTASDGPGVREEDEFDPHIPFKPDGVIQTPNMLALRRAGLCFCGGKLTKVDGWLQLRYPRNHVGVVDVDAWECACGALYRKERAE